MNLSHKQQIFISEYLVCWNASEAARRAGYSANSASAIGHENLRKPEIKAEIARRVADKAMTGDEVLLLLADHARGNLGDFLTIDQGTIKVDLDAAQAAGKLHLIKSYRRTRYGTEIELYSAQEALKTLGQALGVLRENVAVTEKGQVEIVTRVVHKKNDPTDA